MWSTCASRFLHGCIVRLEHQATSLATRGTREKPFNSVHPVLANAQRETSHEQKL